MGMKPLGLFDQLAMPMYDAFGPNPDNADAYAGIPSNISLTERNPSSGRGRPRGVAAAQGRRPRVAGRHGPPAVAVGARARAPCRRPPGPNAAGGEARPAERLRHRVLRMSAETEQADAGPRRAAGRPAAEGPRRDEAVHAVGRPPVLHLRRLPRGGHRHRRHAPRAAATFAAEGWAKVTRQPGVAALTAGPGRHERHERDGLGAAEQLADPRARRPRAGDALGAGVAAGDRPRPVRPPGHEVRRDARGDRGDPGPDRRGADRGAAPALGPGVRRLPARRRVLRGRRGGRARRRCPIPPAARCPTSRASRRCCATPSAR